MMLKRMNILLPLIAGIMVGIIGLIYEYSIMRLAYTMLIVLLVFFIIATVLQKIISKNIDEAYGNKKTDELAIEKISTGSEEESVTEETEPPISPEENDNEA